MSLADEGFRFLHIGGSEYAWTHPLLIPAGAVDCTDMDDDAFADYVAANENP